MFLRKKYEKYIYLYKESIEKSIASVRDLEEPEFAARDRNSQVL